MTDDKRFYTFVFAPTASSRFRQFHLHHKYIYAILGLAGVGLLTVLFGAYRLTQHAVVVARLSILERQNRDLREQNQEAANKYDQLNNRLAALDTMQRKMETATGVTRQEDVSQRVGQGGPDLDNLSEFERVTAALESQIRQIKDVVDQKESRLSSMPSGWPVRGYVSDGFGSRRNPFTGGGSEVHPGLDIATNHGTAIEATADGIVLFAGAHGGYGNIVVVDHGYGITTRYGHMSKIDVQVGEHVTRGKVIGAVGSTGRSTGPHCHYEVRLHDRPVDPLAYLSVGRS